MREAIVEVVGRYPALAPLSGKLDAAAELLIGAFGAGNKLLLAGNGGSASDCDHIAGEFLKGFCSPRRLDAELQKRLEDGFGAAGRRLASGLQAGLPAIHLAAPTGFISAWSNDMEQDLVYAQHLLALARPGDVFWGISTGGGARNILAALQMARTLQVRTLLLTGARHGVCESYADLVLDVPEHETYKIQELHLPVYHALCLAVEQHFFGNA